MSALVVRSATAAIKYDSRHYRCSAASLLLQRSSLYGAKPIVSTHHTFISSVRHASTDTKASTQRVVTDPKFAVQGIVPTLETTRPAPWNLPEAPSPKAYPNRNSLDPFAWDYTYLFQLGKAVGIFFKTGLKNVWGNYKTSKQIRERLQKSGIKEPASAALYATDPAQSITYNEFQLLKRSTSDQWRLLPFFLVFCVCGEFTPLVMPFLGSRMIPSTCAIPRMQSKDLHKAFEREIRFRDEFARNVNNTESRSNTPNQDRKLAIRAAVLRAYTFGLTSRPSYPDWLAGLLYRLRLEPKLKQHCNDILASTALILREGGFSKRSPQDIWEYANNAAIFNVRRYAMEQTAGRGIEPTLENVATEDMKKAALPVLDRVARHIFRSEYLRGDGKDVWRAVLDNPDAEDRFRALFDGPDGGESKSTASPKATVTRLERKDNT